MVATYFLSLHVFYPIFWWLGPWRQWAAQIGLVLLWSGAVAVWSVTLTAYATLDEVTYNRAGRADANCPVSRCWS